MCIHTFNLIFFAMAAVMLIYIAITEAVFEDNGEEDSELLSKLLVAFVFFLFGFFA